MKTVLFNCVIVNIPLEQYTPYTQGWGEWPVSNHSLIIPLTPINYIYTHNLNTPLLENDRPWISNGVKEKHNIIMLISTGAI